MLIAEAERAGVLETGEHRMISGVLRLGDRPVRGLMTPRTDVDWIDLSADAGGIRERVLARPIHACLLVKAAPTKSSAWSRRGSCWPRCCQASRSM